MSRERYYKTKQRKTVLECLRSSGRCLTADEIIRLTVGVSKTTVYRALEYFVAEGYVTRFSGDIGQSAVYRYLKRQKEHCHIRCTECGATECVDGTSVHALEESIRKSNGFTINQAQTVLYGICGKCSEKVRKP